MSIHINIVDGDNDETTILDRLTQLIDLTKTGKLSNRDRHELMTSFNMTIAHVNTTNTERLLNQYKDILKVKRESQQQLQQQQNNHEIKDINEVVEDTLKDIKEEIEYLNNESQNIDSIKISIESISDDNSLKIQDISSVELDNDTANSDSDDGEELKESGQSNEEDGENTVVLFNLGKTYICEGCKKCDEYIRGNTHGISCANCGCPTIDHIPLDDDDEFASSSADSFSESYQDIDEDRFHRLAIEEDDDNEY